MFWKRGEKIWLQKEELQKKKQVKLREKGGN